MKKPLAAVLVVVVALLLVTSSDAIAHSYSVLQYWAAPTAERAFALGGSHLDRVSANEYDVQKAKKYFTQAANLDPEYPYVYHQLARVSFLRGKFVRALQQVNVEIEHHPEQWNSYYLRGLIQGYLGNYDAAIRDYSRYLDHDNSNWAALNDYAWVLLKANRPREAADAASAGLVYFPENPWLLNTRAIALYEMGNRSDAIVFAQAALGFSSGLTAEEWLLAYPGNDPGIAEEGLERLRKAIIDNMHMISAGHSEAMLQ